jgi:hypothetical protein
LDLALLNEPREMICTVLEATTSSKGQNRYL